MLHSREFLDPVPLPVISTAGGEDSPFIPTSGQELYSFFAADVRQEATEPIRHGVMLEVDIYVAYRR